MKYLILALSLFTVSNSAFAKVFCATGNPCTCFSSFHPHTAVTVYGCDGTANSAGGSVLRVAANPFGNEPFGANSKNKTDAEAAASREAGGSLPSKEQVKDWQKGVTH